MVGLALPTLLGAVGLATDVSLWFLEDHRLQIATDAAAHAAAYMLQNTSAQQDSPTSFETIALNEAKSVTGSSLVGTLSNTVAVSIGSGWSSITVTLTSTADSVFSRVLVRGGFSMKATATASLTPPSACILALSKTASTAIDVDNMGSIKATGCGIFSDSNASNAVYLNSGTISGKTVGAVGGIAMSNSGSNNLSPSPGSPNQALQGDPDSSLIVPSYGSCSYSNGTSFTSNNNGQPYKFTAGTVFCGNTTIGGNGSTDQFAPGNYFVVNGNLTFNNADITVGSGVSFILVGSSPGSFNWTNNSATALTAPTSGTTAGMLIWQTCGSSGSPPANIFNGGSALQISGSIYAPCGELELNNNAQITTKSGGTSNVIASTIYATGSAGLSVSGGSSSSTSTQVSLTQ